MSTSMHEDYSLKTTRTIIPVYFVYDTGKYTPFSIMIKKGDEEIEIPITTWDESTKDIIPAYDKLLKGSNIGKQERIEGKLVK